MFNILHREESMARPVETKISLVVMLCDVQLQQRRGWLCSLCYAVV